MTLHTFQPSADLDGWECFMPGRRRGGGQVGHDQHAFLGLGVCASTIARRRGAKLTAVPRALTVSRRGPVHGSKTLNKWAMPGRSDASSTRSGDLQRRRDGQAGVGHPWFARLIHAHLRSPGSVGARGALQPIGPGTAPLGIGLRRNQPLFAWPWGAHVCWRVVRTHSGLMASTTANATSVSAKPLSVDGAQPLGGARPAQALSRASWVPSSVHYGRPIVLQW
jgi:hypothetical protein